MAVTKCWFRCNCKKNHIMLMKIIEKLHGELLVDKMQTWYNNNTCLWSYKSLCLKNYMITVLIDATLALTLKGGTVWPGWISSLACAAMVWCIDWLVKKNFRLSNFKGNPTECEHYHPVPFLKFPFMTNTTRDGDTPNPPVPLLTKLQLSLPRPQHYPAQNFSSTMSTSNLNDKMNSDMSVPLSDK